MHKTRFSMTGFYAGLRSIPEGWRFLLAHRPLLRYAIIPALLNTLIFLAIIWGLWHLGGTAFSRIVAALGLDPAAGSGLGAVLLGAARIVLVVVLALLGWTLLFVCHGIISGIVAGPFAAALGRQVYRIASGGRDLPAGTANGFVQFLRDLVFEARYLAYTIGVSLLLLPLNLLPAVGSLLYLVRSQYFTATLLGWPHLARPLARLGRPFAEQRRFIMAHRPECAGLGAGIMLLLLVPPLNLAQLPVAVTAGMLLYRRLENDS